MKSRLPSLGADRFSGLYAGALFILIFGIWTPSTFLTSATLHSIASDQAIYAIVALALLIPLTTGNFDLTIGAVANLAVVLSIILLNHGWSLWSAILVTIAISALVGVVNGFIVVVLRVSSFIATLGMATVILAVQEIVTGGQQPLPPVSATWANLTQHLVFGFQVIVFYVIALVFFLWWVLDHTPLGRYFYAIGSNAEASRLAGIAVGRWVWLSLIASSTLCGVAGVLYASLTGPSLTVGGSLLLPAFAAVFLGSTQLDPGRVNAWGTLIALYVLGIGVTGLQLVTGVQWLNDMFSGVALLATVSFATWRQRAATRAVARPGTDEKPDRNLGEAGREAGEYRQPASEGIADIGG
jgi:ribose transport system permease protein